jgi:hypothetical protein
LTILSTIPMLTPGVLATLIAREEDPNDDVIIYVGSSPRYLAGHAAIEVDGMIYEYDGSPGISTREEFISEEQGLYQYSYQKYSVNYTANNKQLLKNSLQINQQTNYTLGQYIHSVPIFQGYAYNCTTFVTDSLPSKGTVFDSLVKSQILPYGLGWGLDTMNLLTQGRTVERLPDIDYPGIL